MADTVAEKSGFLCMYMSNHPDTLVAYAKWFGKVERDITSAQMIGITTKDITLTCTYEDGSSEDVKLPIDPPLKGYDDVKPRLLEMKAIAQEGLGMINAPRIDSFELSSYAWQHGFFFTLIAITYLAPPKVIRDGFGPNWIAFIFWAIAFIHIVEAPATFSLCRKHSTFFVGLQYVLASLWFGPHVSISLRERVRNARINSAMEV